MNIEEFSKSLLVDPFASTGENGDSNLLDSSTKGQFDMKFELVDDKLLQLEKNINLETLLNKNVDLVSYAVEVEKKVQLKENELVQQFLDNMPSIDELNESIQFCNNVLQKMDTILVAFNSKLVLINNEIKNLHSESKSIQLKLDNRMKLMSKLGKLMDEILIREDMIETLYSPDITDKFIDEIIKLDKILSNSNQLLKKKQSIKSLNQILTESERLRLKTADTIRHYFLSHYNLIPNTMCNLTKLQQKKLLPKLKLNQFIIERHLGVATECAQHYINNVSGYYASHFDIYARELLKLKLPIQDKSELIGNLESSKSFVLDIPLFNQSKQFTQQKVNYYVMGDRVKIFENLTYSPIIIQNAKELNLKYTFEALFKSFNYALVNSLITEYTFLTQFFGQKTSGKSEGEEESDLMSDVIFKKVFESVFKIGLDFIKTLLDNNHDIIGQLICIQLNLEFQTQLKEFKIELEEFYFNDLRILIWPSIQSSINAHIHSLRRLGAGLNSVDVESHHHHFITRRYSEFSLSLLILNQRQEDQMLTNSLYRLKSEFLNFLQIYQQKIKLIKNKFIFLINNYNLILINYQDYLSLNLVKVEYQVVEGLLNQNIEEFINEEINYNFNDLVALMEPIIEGKISVEQISADKLIKLNNSLKTSWEPNLIKFKSLILKKISNFTLLEVILKNFLTKFLLLYSNFLNCWELKFIKNSSAGGNTGGLQEAPVDLQKVMIVIKRLKDNF